MEMGTKEGLWFDHGFLGDKARLLQCLHYAYLEILVDPFLARSIVVRSSFQEGFGHYANQHTPFKR